MAEDEFKDPWDCTTLADIQKLKEDPTWKAVRSFYLIAFNDLIEQLDGFEDSRFIDGQIIMVKRFLAILDLFETKIKEKSHNERRDAEHREFE